MLVSFFIPSGEENGLVYGVIIQSEAATTGAMEYLAYPIEPMALEACKEAGPIALWAMATNPVAAFVDMDSAQGMLYDLWQAIMNDLPLGTIRALIALKYQITWRNSLEYSFEDNEIPPAYLN